MTQIKEINYCSVKEREREAGSEGWRENEEEEGEEEGRVTARPLWSYRETLQEALGRPASRT